MSFIEIQERIDSAKYAHLMFNDKFNKPFVNFLNKHFESSEHIILCKRRHKEYPFPEGDNVFEVENFKPFVFDKVDKVICHSLFDHNLIDYLYFHKDILENKAYWGIWGGDLYYAQRDEKHDYVRSNFKGYITDKDKDAVLKKYDIKNPSFFPVFLIPPISLDIINSIEILKKDYIQIQINNSCDDSTLEMLDILSRFKNENIKITTVLSYGKLQFKDEIIKKGHEIFGEKFKYIENYMPPEEYAHLLAQNDILILNQNRQQGIGNTTASLAMGVKVFIRSDVTTYNCMKEDGMPIFDTLQISKLNFKELVEYNEDYSKVKMYFDTDIIVKQLKDVFNAK